MVFGGTGLGLAISKQLVDLMNGEIGVRGEPGQGAVCWFAIPFARAAAASIEALKVPERSVQPGTMLAGEVLVVEDNEVNREVIMTLPQSLGLSVACVSNGAEAVKAVANRPFDMVLMDCQMPVMDGFEATRRIRKMAGNAVHGAVARRLPIVALTAHVVAGDREQCIAAGMEIIFPNRLLWPNC